MMGCQQGFKPCSDLLLLVGGPILYASLFIGVRHENLHPLWPTVAAGVALVWLILFFHSGVFRACPCDHGFFFLR